MSAASPEELDTLLEDAALLHDAAALGRLFTCGVLVATADGARVGAEAAALLAGYSQKRYRSILRCGKL